MKSYKSEVSAKRAVKNQALHLMNYEIVKRGIEYHVVFFVHDSEDAFDIQERGFGARIDPDKAGA